MDSCIPPMQKSDEPTNLTIVGGRPSEDGSRRRESPRGLEVLLKKASVDPGFRNLLLEKRSGACEAIGLRLNPAETAMLDHMPVDQIDAIIRGTHVRTEDRHVFLSQVASVMLAALGVAASGCKEQPPSHGIRPERTTTADSRAVAVVQEDGESILDAHDRPSAKNQDSLITSHPNQPGFIWIPRSSPQLSPDVHCLTFGHTVDRPKIVKSR